MIFIKKVILREDEDLDSLLRRFKRQVALSENLDDLKLHEYHMNKAEKRAAKMKRLRKKLKKVRR